MRACNEIRDRFIEALYEELPEDRRREFEDHLRRCPDCTAQFEDMRSTLSLMDQRTLDAPDEEFWSRFSQELNERAARESESSNAKVVKLLPKTPSRTSRRLFASAYLQAAAAVAILALGIWIGKAFFTPGLPEALPESANLIADQTGSVSEDGLHTRVNSYMRRSQTLLLGLVHLDPSDDTADGFDLSAHRRVSQSLISEAPELRREIEEAGHQRLLQLIDDLEEILIQIANLEARQDLQGVELISDGVRRRGILLQIQLERIRPSTRSTEEGDRRGT